MMWSVLAMSVFDQSTIFRLEYQFNAQVIILLSSKQDATFTACRGFQRCYYIHARRNSIFGAEGIE